MYKRIIICIALLNTGCLPCIVSPPISGAAVEVK